MRRGPETATQAARTRLGTSQCHGSRGSVETFVQAYAAKSPWAPGNPAAGRNATSQTWTATPASANAIAARRSDVTSATSAPIDVTAKAANQGLIARPRTCRLGARLAGRLVAR